MISKLDCYAPYADIFHGYRQRTSQRELNDYKGVQEEITSVIAKTRQEIERLKVQLKAERVERRHKEECDLLVRKINELQSRDAITKQHSAKMVEYDSVVGETVNLSLEEELRQKQFSLLLYAIADLQKAYDETDVDAQVHAATVNIDDTGGCVADDMQVAD